MEKVRRSRTYHVWEGQYKKRAAVWPKCTLARNHPSPLQSVILYIPGLVWRMPHFSPPPLPPITPQAFFPPCCGGLGKKGLGPQRKGPPEQEPDHCQEQHSASGAQGWLVGYLRAMSPINTPFILSFVFLKNINSPFSVRTQNLPRW